jgi:two-component system OmpR family sensor kinase
MTLSLRDRLLVGLVVVVVAGLTAFGFATYKQLDGFLTQRLDDQLASGYSLAYRTVVPDPNSFPVPRTEPVPGAGPAAGLPQGTYTAFVAPDGTVLYDHTFDFGGTTSDARPELPHPLPNAGPDKRTDLTVAGTGGVRAYRVLIESLDNKGGAFLVIAIPTTELDSTLAQLLQLELLVGGAVLLGMALLAFTMIRVGLRPLERMGATAAAIAAGDLSRRVEPATMRTEIGRLGLALNAMLAQIEEGFRRREATERQLRRFIADASHELRTPLTSIRGYAEMLRRGAGASPEDSAIARRRIEEESIRMTGLVDDMLLLARLDQGRPLDQGPVDLRSIARDAIADARAVSPGRSIKLNAPGSVVVVGDDQRLRQVVGNLVRNAIVHTPAKTPIEVEVAAQNGHAEFTVIDHGAGLPEGSEKRVFEPFFRADPGRSRDKGGSGLGLPIVAAVVAAHGGKVTADRTNGGGATFRVTLPMAAA